jgi:hypothetical protein
MVRLYLGHHRPDLLVPDPEGTLPDVTGVDRVVLPVELVVRDSA